MTWLTISALCGGYHDVLAQNGVQIEIPCTKEQLSSAPVVCNKACPCLRYAETLIQDGKPFKTLPKPYTVGFELVIHTN